MLDDEEAVVGLFTDGVGMKVQLAYVVEGGEGGKDAVEVAYGVRVRG